MGQTTDGRPIFGSDLLDPEPSSGALYGGVRDHAWQWWYEFFEDGCFTDHPIHVS